MKILQIRVTRAITVPASSRLVEPSERFEVSAEAAVDMYKSVQNETQALYAFVDRQLAMKLGETAARELRTANLTARAPAIQSDFAAGCSPHFGWMRELCPELADALLQSLIEAENKQDAAAALVPPESPSIKAEHEPQ